MGYLDTPGAFKEAAALVPGGDLTPEAVKSAFAGYSSGLGAAAMRVNSMFSRASKEESFAESNAALRLISSLVPAIFATSGDSPKLQKDFESVRNQINTFSQQVKMARDLDAANGAIKAGTRQVGPEERAVSNKEPEMYELLKDFRSAERTYSMKMSPRYTNGTSKSNESLELTFEYQRIIIDSYSTAVARRKERMK
jgi:hypothetical protein